MNSKKGPPNFKEARRMFLESDADNQRQAIQTDMFIAPSVIKMAFRLGLHTRTQEHAHIHAYAQVHKHIHIHNCQAGALVA